MGVGGSIISTVVSSAGSIFGFGSSSSSSKVPIAYALPGSELKPSISRDTRVLTPATIYDIANYKVLSAIGDNQILVYGTAAAVIFYVVLKK